MKTRFIAAVAALALAPAAFAEEAAASRPAAADTAAPTAAPAAAATAAPAAADTAALEGKIDALAEQYAETKNDVASLKKLKLSGYVQGRYSWLESTIYNASNGTASPARGNFYVRRARLKATYSESVGQLVIQVDAATDKTVLKEGYAKVNLPAGMSVDVGLQLLPFGYEVGVVSSANLDLLERSAAAGRWLKGEYDMGVALNARYGPVTFRGGLFNGNGVDGKNGTDNDQLKDVIGRVGLDLGVVTGGLSGWYGKVKDYTAPDDKAYDRTRYGADLQVFLDLLPFGGTAVKGEYLIGTTAIGTGANGGGDALGVKGRGWYGALIQNVGLKDQLAIRFQQYTPDEDLDLAATGNTGKVKTTNELSAAVHHHLGDTVKLSVAYYHPMNGEKGSTAASDPKADQFTFQAQARF